MSAAQYLARLGVQAQGGVYTLSDSFQTLTLCAKGERVYAPGERRALSTAELKRLLHPTPNLNAAGLNSGHIWTPLGRFFFETVGNEALLSERPPHASDEYGLFIGGGLSGEFPLVHHLYRSVTARRGYLRASPRVCRHGSWREFHPSATFADHIRELEDLIWNAVMTKACTAQLKQQVWTTERAQRQAGLDRARALQQAWALAIEELEKPA